MVEVVSCLERDGRPVFRDLRWGVLASTFKAPNEYARICFKEYGLKTDSSGWYAAMYKPYHLIGLELGMSVLSAALRGEPTGQPSAWCGDAVAIAKRLPAALASSRRARAATCRAARAGRAQLAEEGVPAIDLTWVPLVRAVAAGEIVRWADVEVPDSAAARVRRDMERRFAPSPAAIAAQ